MAWETTTLGKGMNALAEGRLPYRVSRWLQKESHVKLATQSLFNLVYATPPVESRRDAEHECITLLDRTNVTAYLIAIKSFLRFSSHAARVTVLSDGSLSQTAIGTLERHVRGVRVLVQDGFWRRAFPGRPGLQDARARFVLTRKLLDLPFGDLRPRLVFLDSDVVFKRDIDADFFDLQGLGFRYNRDHDHRLHDKLFHHVVRFMEDRGMPASASDVNSGLMLVNRDAIQPDLIADFFAYLIQRNAAHDLMEQDCYNVLAAAAGARPLSDEYWVGCNPDHAAHRGVARRAIAKHYVGGVRYQRLDYARDFLAILPALMAGRTPAHVDSCVAGEQTKAA